MAMYKIAGAALNQTPIDWENNVKNIVQAIGTSIEDKIDILCLPELCITGYGCEDLFLHDWVHRRALQYLPEIVDASKNITVAVGLPLKWEGKLYNCVCLISDQKIVGFNPKQNLANDGVHYEPRWFKPWPVGKVGTYLFGDVHYPFGDIINEVNGLKIGFEICEDAWQEEVRPGHSLFTKTVDLILNPSASHFSFAKSKLREELVISSSLKFNCCYLYANLLGNEAGRMIFDGEILIGQKGKLIGRNNRLSFKNINIVAADIDFKNPENSHSEALYDEHDKNTEFIKASALALFDYLRKSRSSGFVLSLSGGADSSTCAVLVTEMVKRGVKELGLSNFLDKLDLKKFQKEIETGKDVSEQIKIANSLILSCAYQGTKNSTEDTFNSAAALAESLGATFYNWQIDEEVKSYTSKIENALGRELTWETDDISLQNIQARARSPIIWMLTNIKNALLIATSNRSEGDVGYTTMDGDTSGSISPIAAVDKHFLLQWLKWAETSLGYKELRHVNNLHPSAELRPHEYTQTDEADLMPYRVIVQIEELAIRDRKSPLEVYNILKFSLYVSKESLKGYIIKFYKMWSRSQWKRERFAPSFHLDDFNVDSRTWCRFPILSGGFEAELKILQETDDED